MNAIEKEKLYINILKMVDHNCFSKERFGHLLVSGMWENGSEEQGVLEDILMLYLRNRYSDVIKTIKDSITEDLVYLSIQAKRENDYRALEEGSDKFLKKGDIIRIEHGDNFYANIPKHFVYSNRKNDFELTRSIVTSSEKIYWFKGNYEVINTLLDGGGENGSHSGGVPDVFPNGHHVYCRRIDEESNIEIDFYQSGSFTAMLPYIRPIMK